MGHFLSRNSCDFCPPLQRTFLVYDLNGNSATPRKRIFVTSLTLKARVEVAWVGNIMKHEIFKYILGHSNQFCS